MPSTTSPTSSTLPPPQTFDIIPPLHTLLSRLLAPQDGTTSTAALNPKDLATEASAIKIRIQKARVAVAALPDMDRTVEQQEEEIEELEATIERLRGNLRRIGELAKGTGES